MGLRRSDLRAGRPDLGPGGSDSRSGRPEFGTVALICDGSPNSGPERSDFRSGRPDLKSRRSDLRSERPDLKPERPDLRPGKPNLGPERSDLRSVGGEREARKNCPVWNHRSSAPPWPLPKKGDFEPEKAVLRPGRAD